MLSFSINFKLGNGCSRIKYVYVGGELDYDKCSIQRMRTSSPRAAVKT